MVGKCKVFLIFVLFLYLFTILYSCTIYFFLPYSLSFQIVIPMFIQYSANKFYSESCFEKSNLRTSNVNKDKKQAGFSMKAEISLKYSYCALRCSTSQHGSAQVAMMVNQQLTSICAKMLIRLQMVFRLFQQGLHRFRFVPGN